MARHGRGRRGEDRGATAHRPRRPLPPRRDGGRSTAATLAEVLKDLASVHDQCDVVLFLGAGDIADVARDLPGGLVE